MNRNHFIALHFIDLAQHYTDKVLEAEPNS